MAKDCPWQTKDFDLTKSKETVAQQFAVVNSIDTMKATLTQTPTPTLTLTPTLTPTPTQTPTPTLTLTVTLTLTRCACGTL